MADTKVLIGQAYDGFTVIIDGQHFWINQEDDVAKELVKVFSALGYEAQVFEDY